MIDSIKKELYENPNYAIIIFFFITFIYFITPYVGLIISIIVILSGHLVLKTDDYFISTVSKLYLVFITSFLIFSKICNLLPFNINTIVRILLFLNVLAISEVMSPLNLVIFIYKYSNYHEKSYLHNFRWWWVYR